jgi:iron(III) transport system ATP-binding protein
MLCLALYWREHEAQLMADNIGYVQQGEYCASQHRRAEHIES